MQPGLRKPILPRCKISCNFEIFKFNTLLSFISIVIKISSYAILHKAFNITYRCCIAHTEWEIGTVIWMGVFYVDKTGFLRPSHIYTINSYF